MAPNIPSSSQITEKIISELKKIAFCDFSEVTNAIDTEENAELLRQFAGLEKYFPAISQVKAVKDGVEIKFYDKLKAIELLGKYIKQQNGDEPESDFDNLISILRGKADQIWRGGDTD